MQFAAFEPKRGSLKTPNFQSRNVAQRKSITVNLAPKPKSFKRSRSTDNKSVNSDPIDICQLKSDLEQVNNLIIVEGNKTPRVSTKQLDDLPNNKAATKAPSSPRYRLSFKGKRSTAHSYVKND